MYSFKLEAQDGKKISINVWDDVKERKGAVYIAHGMAEHPDRYDRFAAVLNENGYVVLADDHRGHRNNPYGDKGVTEGDAFSASVEDMRLIIDYIKTGYGFKAVLLGHSYGSFLAQKYIQKYGKNISKCILSGTAFIKNPLLVFGYAISAIQKVFVGERATGKLIDKLSFGAYNKPFKSEGNAFNWLSRDKAEVEKYEADEYCGYPMSVGFYNGFFKNALALYKKTSDIPQNLPILIAVGSEDPVSFKAKAARKLYDHYKKLGLKAELKIYEGARHEILNETNREEVFNDFLRFIQG